MWPENFNADHWLADNLINLGVNSEAIPYATLAFDLTILVIVAFWWIGSLEESFFGQLRYL